MTFRRRKPRVLLVLGLCALAMIYTAVYIAILREKTTAESLFEELVVRPIPKSVKNIKTDRLYDFPSKPSVSE